MDQKHIAPAVIPTNPARAPFNIFAKSGLLFKCQEVNIEDNVPAGPT